MKISTKLIYIFGLVVLFVVYFFGIYSNLTPEAVRDDFRERRYSADLALTLESVQALRRDVNLELAYGLPEGLSAQVVPHNVRVYAEDIGTGEDFGFAVNPEYRFPEVSLLEQAVLIRRMPGRVLFDEPGMMMDDVLCPPVALLNTSLSVSDSFFPAAAEFLVNTFSDVQYSDFPRGGIFVGFLPSERGVRVYVSDDGLSRGIGCRIMKSFVREFPFSDINVIPIHGEIFAEGDARRPLQSPGANIMVAFDSSLYSDFVIASAVSEGLSDYGLV